MAIIFYLYNNSKKDTLAPVIIYKKELSTEKGVEIELLKDVLVKDNVDKNIKVSIVGNYNFETVGKYNLQYVAIDSSGNKTVESFTLIITESVPEQSSKVDNIETPPHTNNNNNSSNIVNNSKPNTNQTTQNNSNGHQNNTTNYYCQDTWELKGDKCYQESGYYAKKEYNYYCPSGYYDVTMHSDNSRKCAKETYVNPCDSGRYFSSTGLCHQPAIKGSLTNNDFNDPVFNCTEVYQNNHFELHCYYQKGVAPKIVDGNLACSGYDTWQFDKDGGKFKCVNFINILSEQLTKCKTGYTADLEKEQENYIYCTTTNVKNAYKK